jgi:hypothetical protein
MNIDKKRLKDSTGRPLTQSLFLEIGYDEDKAIFTFKDEDHEYKGNTYYSLKRLYLEMEDPTEYEFANRYLLGWQHWKRLKANKILAKHFAEWEEELELRLRAQGIRAAIDQAAEDKGFQAAKWLADKGWQKNSVGRPSKHDKLREERMQAKLDDEFSADVVRLMRD